MGELDQVPICAIGDSMVAGLGDSSGLGWTVRLVQAAREAGLSLHMTNLGIRGDTSELILSRWEEVDRRITAWPETAVLCEFGVNDVMERDGRERVSEAVTLRSLRQMCELAPAGRLLVIGPPPVEWQEINERVEARSEAIARECAALGLPFVPTFPTLESLPLWRDAVAAGDGAHPDSAGWEAFAAVVSPRIIEWIAGWAAR